MASAIAASGAGDTGATRFFALLIGATLLPYAVLPLSAHVAPGSALLGDARESLIFVASGGHVAASFFFYGDPRVRSYMGGRKARYFVAPLCVIASTGLFLLFGNLTLITYGISAYWIWQTHHYTRQNQGILAFASRAFGQPVRLSERAAVTLSGVAGVIGALTFVSPFKGTFLADWGWHLHATALCVYASAWIAWVWAQWETRGESAPLRSCVFFGLVLFYVPLFLFQDMVSAVFTYAMAHGLQYMIFLGYVAAEPRARRWPRALGLLTCLGLGGWMLLAMQRSEPWGDLRMGVYGAYLGIVMSHFLLDAGMWRLSEPFQRSYMAERFRFLAPRAR